MKRSGAAYFTIAIALLFTLMLAMASEFRFWGWAYPVIVGVPCLVITLILLVRELRGKVSEESGMDLIRDDSISRSLAYKRAARYLGWILALYLGIWLLGFKLAIPLFFVLFIGLEGKSKWWIVLALTGLAVFMILIPFGLLLGVYWPMGLIEQFLDLPF
ncbi:hypothetical protein ACFLUO_07500 [Chloroflexota bacterium]